MRTPLLWSAAGAVAAAVVVAGTWWVRDDASDPGKSQDTPWADPDPWLPKPSFHFDDPSGDATDTGAGDAATLAGCVVGGVLGGACVDVPVDAPPLGTPGPHFDIVGVDFLGETVHTVQFALTIAQLSEGLPELKDPDGFTRMAYYELCWAPAADAGCNRQVRVDAMTHGGAAHLEPKFEIRTGDCNEWNWCSWDVGFEIQYGAPATMTFRVAKAYLDADGGPLGVHHMEATTGWIAEPSLMPAWHPGLTVHTPVRHVHTHGGALITLNIADVTKPFPTDVTLTGAPARPVIPIDVPLLVGGEGANHGSESPYNYPEMDILWYDMFEEGADLVAVFALKELQAVPTYDFDYSVGVGIGQQVWEIGYRHEGGQAYGYAGRCIMEECQDGAMMEPQVDVVLGSPGYLLVRTPLEFLGNPAPATETNLFWAMTMYSDRNVYWGEYDEALFGDVHSVFEIDSLRGGGMPYVFGSGHRAPLSAPPEHVHA